MVGKSRYVRVARDLSISALHTKQLSAVVLCATYQFSFYEREQFGLVGTLVFRIKGGVLIWLAAWVG